MDTPFGMPPMPGFDYFFSPDSITIVCPDKTLCDSMKICQPFSWNGEGFKNTNTPFLGVTPGENTDAKGASIGSIIDGSTAQSIDLEVNDVIVSLNGTAIKHFDHLKEIISSMEVGSDITIEVNRAGRSKTLKGTLGGKPCSSNEDFRIFHDYQGMDEDGNYYYNFEFDMDEEDLESQMEELLNQITNQEERLLEEKARIEEQLRTLRENGSSTFEISIDIMDISNADVEEVNSNEKTRVTNNNDLVFNRISLFPNPGIGVVQLSFEVPSADKFEVTVLNSQGSEVHYESYLGMKEYNNTIDLTRQAKGIYYLIIKQNDKTFSKKLIVQ
jgi:membrane-associated protease RseP (regulator of RpoE activity)